ncbi:TPA: hypothetical protein CPT95_03655 [Candidatus Gastranaerophilales bacterium HUM_15]|jgi:hypothetical protein|nr:MAG TPA: hypothetical protein CPT95_03655 [Candidatus Gastranaerophilales bacterium HUM_15]
MIDLYNYLVYNTCVEVLMNNIEFEYFLKGKLAENGLNISKLAEMLGTSQANVSQRIKRGSFNCIELYHIADLLGYKIEWIKTSEGKRD